MSTVYVQVIGGLANQLWQFAAALNFAKQNNIDNVICDPTWLEALKNTPGITPRDYALEPFGAVCGAATASATRLEWNSIDRNGIVSDDYILHGYFQNKDIVTDEIADLFLSKLEERKGALPLRYGLRRPGYSVMVHIRRGDYVTNPNAFAHHGVLGEEYYQLAMQVMAKYAPTSVFVATEDVEYVRDNLHAYIPRGPYTTHVVDMDAIDTLALMSLCDAHIIANSSFSWWGARLSKSSNVIYPNQWTRHSSAPELMYPEWVGI